jgi:hypothetical protein
MENVLRSGGHLHGASRIFRRPNEALVLRLRSGEVPVSSRNRARIIRPVRGLEGLAAAAGYQERE